jgi:hypothetical protein
MTAPALHADVWVVQGPEVVLLKHTPVQLWQEQLRMPTEQFMGSAAGLSSLSCTDTLVLVNLPSTSDTNNTTSTVWAGVLDSPLRLVQCQATAAIDQLIHNLRLMGAKPLVVCASQANQCVNAHRLVKISKAETRHLKHWLEQERAAPGRLAHRLQLFGRLIAKPGMPQQKQRLTVALCVACSALLVQWATQTQFAEQLTRIAPKPTPMAKPDNQTAAAAWQTWRAQLEKINTGKNANLSELQWGWQTDGTIHTQAMFEKPRKRVPKGCTLHAPVVAQCTATNMDPVGDRP